MQRQKFAIKVIGVFIILFAAAHLFLNLCIMILPLQKVMHALSHTLGPIAIRDDRNFVILCVKVLASALFLTSGIGIITRKAWSRTLLFCLLGLRIMYGAMVCISIRMFHPHLAVIVAEGVFLWYYLTRPAVREEFK